MHEACSDNRTWQVARSIALCVPLLLIVGLSRPALAAPGDLDNSFSNDGKVTTLMGSSGIGHAGVAQSVAIQTDGKIVAAGQVGGGNTERFALARYKINGNLDNSFSGDGKVTTPIGSNSSAASVAIQSDGMIVVAGSALISNNTRFALARYQTNGNLDPTFGSNGKVHTPIGLAAEARSVAIQPSDGKIVAAGYSTGVSNSRFALARYQTNGTLDTVFNSTGKVITPFGSSSIAGAASVAIQTDGNIVAAGYSGSGSNSRFALARYQTTGGLDNSFSGNGKVTTTLGPYSDATSVAIQPSDGKIVAAGNAIKANKGVFAVARYDPTTGSLDTGFSGNGKVTTLIGNSAGAASVAIQPSDGKIVVAGQGSTGNHFRFAVARYDN